MRRETKKKIVVATALIVVLLMILSIVAPVILSSAQTTGSLDSQYAQLQNTVKNLEKQQKDIAAKIKSNKADQATIKQQIKLINSNMSAVKQQIDLLNNQINACNTKIAKQDSDIAATQKRIDDNTALYKQRMCTLYEAGNVSKIQVLLSSKSITDFLTRYEIINMIAQHDTDQLTQLKSDKVAILGQKQVLVSQKNQLLSIQTQLNAKNQSYQGQAAQSTSLYSQLKDKAAALVQKDDEIDAAEEKANAQLANIIKQKEEEARKAAEANGGSYNYVGGTWLWPIQNFSGQYISSDYGVMRKGHRYAHTGIDIAGGGIYGHPILAANSGTVIIAGYDSSGVYGNYVVIDHGGGYSTLYGHASRLNCSVGDKVSRGQVISYVGSTGNSTGPHLHFQIMINGNAVNPHNYVGMP